jgi:class 3 adenylate cyclase
MSGTPEEAAEAVVTVFLDGARQGDVAAASITTLSAMPRGVDCSRAGARRLKGVSGEVKLFQVRPATYGSGRLGSD